MDAPSPAWDAARIVAHLEGLGTADNRAGMGRFGINIGRAFGVGNSQLRPMARKLRRDHARAAALWETGWREARLLACFTEEPSKVTTDQARAWAADFDSWEIVDHAADLFVDARLSAELIPEFAADEREFVRRAAFTMIAWGAVHLKKEPDEAFLDRLPLIEAHATDPRNFVKKAVNWALRQIGKRSHACHGPSLALAEKLAASDDRTARWIGRHAVRELTAGKTLARLAAKAGDMKAHGAPIRKNLIRERVGRILPQVPGAMELAMSLLKGIHHLTFLTNDMDRLMAFYERVFDAEVTLDLEEDGLRHAFIEVGPDTVLHPFQVPGKGPPGEQPMFDRGRLDHFAMHAASEEAFRELRRRLIAEGATDGMVTDMGMIYLMSFSDPDDGRHEIVWHKPGATTADSLPSTKWKPVEMS